jgi:hypothetical protein
MKIGFPGNPGTFQGKMRYAQLVMGPAGSGKSTYCAAVAAHAQVYWVSIQREYVLFIYKKFVTTLIRLSRRKISDCILLTSVEMTYWYALGK